MGLGSGHKYRDAGVDLVMLAGSLVGGRVPWKSGALTDAVFVSIMGDDKEGTKWRKDTLRGIK